MPIVPILIRHRDAIGQVLGLMACTVTVIYFEYVFDWNWYASIPVGVLAFVSALNLWGRLVVYLSGQQPRSE